LLQISRTLDRQPFLPRIFDESGMPGRTNLSVRFFSKLPAIPFCNSHDSNFFVHLIFLFSSAVFGFILLAAKHEIFAFSPRDMAENAAALTMP